MDNIKDLLEKGQLGDDLLESLKKLSLECNKDESSRVFAGKNGALGILLSTCQRFVKDENLFAASLDTFCSFVQGQGNVVNSETIKFLSGCLKDYQERDQVTGMLVKAVRLSCIMSEANRQAFVEEGVIPVLVEILKTHRQSPTVIKEACFALRVLTFDDDMSVPFGKAHEHAKLIVAENALPVMLEMLDAVQQNVETASELMATLGRLAVRDEFCKEIVDLGGLKMILQMLQGNMKHQVSSYYYTF